jgi:hypothetical protein
MTIINLAGQQTLATNLTPAFNAWKNALIDRKPVWNKISPQKRLAWINSNKDPIMDLVMDNFSWISTLVDEIREAQKEA